MNITDIVIPILGFILVIVSAISLKKRVSNRKIIELIIGLIIMGFSIWASIDNSETLNNIDNTNKILQSKLDEVLEKRKVDSNNNTIFQRYLKDTFGIERQGNKPVKYIYQTTNYYPTQPTTNSIQSKKYELNGSTDSINFNVKLVNNILYLSPKEGTWVHAYFAFDTANSSQFNAMLEEGMGTPNVADKIYVNNKIFNTHIIKIFDRPVYSEEPIKLNISAYMNGYFIFGEQGNNNKRYIYRQGKVTWIPQ